MDTGQALEFFRTNHRAVVATLRADGAPALTPVTVGVDGEQVVVSTRETAVKVRNLRRDPRLWICGLNDGFFGDWVQAEGPVEIVSLPDAMEGLIDYYRQISGEHPDWDDYRTAMVRDQRCLLRVTLARVGPSVQG
jgi:PPOX class probable F420-dependent enzyme